MSDHQDNHPKSQSKSGPLTVLRSVISAAFGVRNSRHRGKEAKFRHYVLAAVIFVVLFLIVVNSVVRLVLSQTA